ncbi:MAG: 2-oxoacid:acceptor oxidoreductase subunit alpha [Syntrophobacterales bacterium]|nr:MAG: 2-oxoacid:acceptor oxidoreductase subunit alpha [Syntrophobacterales bacterium]
MAWKRIKASLPPGRHYFSGNEAVAEGAISAGCRFYAGYPITPSSEIMERMAHRLGQTGGVFVQMEDELSSISAVTGASWAGAKAMTATSGPGFSLMMEGIGYAAFTETPCVIVDIQRAGPSTGQATRVGSGDIMQAKWGSHGDYQIIVLSPWSVQEMYEQTIQAFNLAERYRVPTFLMGEEAVGHLRENLEIEPWVRVFDRKKATGRPPFEAKSPRQIPPMPSFGEGERLLVTGSTHDGLGIRRTDDPKVHARLIERINDKILLNKPTIVDVDGFFLDDARVAVLCYGFTARSSLSAVKGLREEGYRVGFMRLKTLWPFPHENVGELSERVERIFVPEMNRGQVGGEAMKSSQCEIISFCQTNGEVIRPEVIRKELMRLL